MLKFTNFSNYLLFLKEDKNNNLHKRKEVSTTGKIIISNKQIIWSRLCCNSAIFDPYWSNLRISFLIWFSSSKCCAIVLIVLFKNCSEFSHSCRKFTIINWRITCNIVGIRIFLLARCLHLGIFWPESWKFCNNRSHCIPFFFAWNKLTSYKKCKTVIWPVTTYTNYRKLNSI